MKRSRRRRPANHVPHGPDGKPISLSDARRQASALRTTLRRRGLIVLERQETESFSLGYHELKECGLVERHATNQRHRSQVRYEYWGPRWASDYALFLRSALGGTRSFNARVAELMLLAADPAGPDQARAFMALAGYKT